MIEGGGSKPLVNPKEAFQKWRVKVNWKGKKTKSRLLLENDRARCNNDDWNHEGKMVPFLLQYFYD